MRLKKKKSTWQLVNAELDPSAIYHLCSDQGKKQFVEEMKREMTAGLPSVGKRVHQSSS